MYALQDPKQPCSNRGRQIFTKRNMGKITSISSDQSRRGLHSLFLLFPDYHTMESTPQSDMLGNLARNLQNQFCEGWALQAQLIPKPLPFSLFSSFYLSLFLLICLIFFILPFSHSTSDNPQSWGHTKVKVILWPLGYHAPVNVHLYSLPMIYFLRLKFTWYIVDFLFTWAEGSQGELIV